ncbi:hypothetical protein BGX31_004337 [Mortierella sp. GBA43]|nr:hypothetical protein BGX31_004337 [Mortierella sp. GBA43]
MENGAVSRMSSSTSFQQSPHHYLPIMMTNGSKMPEPAYSYLGSKSDPAGVKESRTLEADNKTMTDSTSTSSNPSTDSSHQKSSLHQASEAESSKKQTSNQSSKTSGGSSSSKHTAGAVNEQSSSSTSTSTSTSTGESSRNASKAESSKSTGDRTMGEFDDFDGSELSDLSSASSASGSEHDSEDDAKEDSSADEQASDESKGDEEDEDESMEDMSASDDSASRSKPKRTKGSTAKGTTSKALHRRRIQRGGQWSTENADMENTNPQTNGEHQPKKRTKQPDLANVGKRDRSGRTQLFKYTAIGDLEACRKLIEAGAQVNDRDNAEWTPLHEACVTGHEKVAELLIQHNADVNAKGGQADTPLHDAAQNGHVEVVKLLLSHGANVLAKNTKGVIPLDVTDDKEVMELLQRRQALITMLTGKNQAGQTLLHRSCSSGSYSNVVELLNQGADIHARDNAQWTPLHEAALEGHTKVVEVLLSRGADPNAQGHGNDTALHDSAQNEHADVVRLLLEYGADPDLKNSKGEKPCDVTEDDEILELLKTAPRGTKKPIMGSTGSSAAPGSASSTKAQTSGVSLSSSSTLFGGAKAGDKGARHKEGSADVNMSDEGRSASEERPVQMSRDERKMQQLLSTIRMQEQMEERKKAKKKQTKRVSDDEADDVSRESKSSRSLDWKQLKSSSKTVSRGSRNGAKRRSSRSEERDDESDSEQEKPRSSRRSAQRSGADRLSRIDHRFKDPSGRTQLHQWAESGNIEMVGTLLEGGADRDPKDNEGLTPLHLAARVGNTEVMVLLLAYGSNVNIQDLEKTTALHEAVRNHHIEAVRLLLQNNALVGLRDSKKRTCLDLVSSKDTEIRTLLKTSMEQAEQKAKERSKKRLSQSIEFHESPKHKERKTSRHSDNEEPVKSRKKDSDRRDPDERKQHSRNNSGSGTLSKSVSMPSIAVNPQPAPTFNNVPHIMAVAMPGITGNWRNNNSETTNEDAKVPLKKQRPHSRRTSSTGASLGMFEADDDVEMKPSGSSKKRREADRNGDEYGGRVKIKKEREDDSQHFHLSGIASKTDDLRRVASLPSFPKDNNNSNNNPHGPNSSRLSRHASKPSLSARPMSIHGSSVATISPPLTDTSSSPPPTTPSTSAVQDLENRSRKRSSQSFSSPAGYQKFADELKLVNKASQHQRQRSVASNPSSRAADSSTASHAMATTTMVESEAARKKPKTSCTSDLTIGQANGKPLTKEGVLATTPAPGTVTAIATSNGYEGGPKSPRKGDEGDKISPAMSERIKKEEAVENHIPAQRSVQDAQRYLPLYTVQLPNESTASSTPPSSLSSSSSCFSSSSSTAAAASGSTPAGTQHFSVVDRQVQLLLGLGPGELFNRYPHLHRRMINKREKARLWSPLSSMVSDRCAAAVKLNFEVLPAECQFSSWTNATTAMSRLKEHEKQKFLGCEAYFIRLEEVVELIKRDYPQLNESMMTIMLDIGYDEEEVAMEIEESSSKSTKALPPLPPGTENKLLPEVNKKREDMIMSSSSSSAAAAVVAKDNKTDNCPSQSVVPPAAPRTPLAAATTNPCSGSSVSVATGFMHKMRRVPAKMATKAMFKELQQHYRPS